MPDFAKESELEESVRGNGEGEGQRRGLKHNPRIIRKILNYAEKGYSISMIAAEFMHQRLRKPNGVRWPSERTMFYMLREDPDLEEQFKARYRGYIDDQARQLVPLASKWGQDIDLAELLKAAKRLPNIRGLKPSERVIALDRMIQRVVDIQTAKVNAQDKRVQRTLQIAGRQLPRDWGENAEEESNTIIFDIGREGPTKTTGLPGSENGQNVAALAAMRTEEKERLLAAMSPEARANALRVLADLEKKPKQITR